MNSILFFEEECSGDIATCEGQRALYLYDTHEVRAETHSLVSVWNRGRGEGECVFASKEKVQFKFILNQSPREKLPVHFIVGASRPQTTKKILQFAAMSGASSVTFVGTENGEKSYLSSKVFTFDSIKTELVKGLEQSGDCNPPDVKVEKSIFTYLKESSNSLTNATRLLAEPGGANTNIPKLSSGSTFYLAIGPEAGWSQSEVKLFKEANFIPVSFGERVMRVEFAAAFFLGAING